MYNIHIHTFKDSILLNEQQQNKKLFKAIINNTAELKSLKSFIE